MPAPFLDVITRTTGMRPAFLAKNIASLVSQTDPDYRQHFLRDYDPQSHGLAWANAHLANWDYDHLEGDYVLVLDDDDTLVNPGAIALLKDAAHHAAPGIIIFRGNHDRLGVLPPDFMIGMRPQFCQIGSCDFITRRDLFLEHIHNFDQPKGGDFHFIDSMWEAAGRVFWISEILSAVQRISEGSTE